MISKILHKKIDKCENMEDLEGVLWELHEFGAERSWLYSHASYKAVKLLSTGGLKIVSKILKPSYHTLSTMGTIWEKYRGRRGEYPRLSFSFFSTLAHFDIPKEDIPSLLEKAEDNAWTVAKFRSWLEDQYRKKGQKTKIEKHACPDCGVVHKKNVKH